MLKIIGIVILAIIAFIIFLLCLVLFAAVRYKINLEADGDIKSVRGILKVRWILGIVSLTVKYPGEGQVVLRIFGIPVSGRKKRKKRKKKKKVKAVKREEKHEARVEEKPAAVKPDKTETENPHTKEQHAKEQHTKKPHKKQRKSFFKKFTERKNKDKKFDKIKPIFAVLKDTQNKGAVDALKNAVICAIKHCGPKKFKVNMIIGTGDPCNTGLLFGAFGIIMALIKGEYNISPDFYNKRIEGYMYIKGRIRSAVVLYYILKIYADKDIKRMAGQIKKARS
ncbi:MAG: DUF2953 domain-containing protein [Lachnospiraceae bacterium]